MNQILVWPVIEKLFTCHYPKSKSMVLEFLYIFLILILSILLSQRLDAVKSRSTNQRLIRRSEGKAKILQEMPKMAAQARKCMCHCVGHLLRRTITSARGHGRAELSGLALPVKNTFRHILLVGIILIAVRNPNI